MEFRSKGLPMTRQGLADALDRLGLAAGQAAALWAVFEVETAGLTQGFGFRPDRRPHILFERHKFKKFTDGRFNQSHPALSGRPGGYGSLNDQYPKLEAALDLCVDHGLGLEPALKSASWGIGQVMGFNHEAAGYASAETMVTDMVQSEDAQLMAMVGFMLDARLDAPLRNHQWRPFARGYNGSGYERNRYHLKLEAQYARFSSGSMPNLEVRTAQAALLLLGFAPGKIDGVLGPRTGQALTGFQIAHQINPDGQLTDQTYLRLTQIAFT
ncbi:MAG: DUF3380 domain-containing protein [Acidobacteria bacterium]|nr:DUF3380 domain-containing protein [Acidobacteriota bacterium]